MDKTHIILVGFGDVGTKIYPALMKIREENREQNTLYISIVDILSKDEMLKTVEPKLKSRFRDYSDKPYDEKEHLEFLKNNYFQDLYPDNEDKIPKGIMDRTSRKTIVYLALDPDKYKIVLKKFSTIGDIFAIEKPIAKNPTKAKEIVDYAKQSKTFFVKKSFIPIDHYLGKDAFYLFDMISNNPRFKDIINDSNLITFSFLEKDIIPPIGHPYFRTTGIIADMMPHVSAVLKKIFKNKFELKFQRVKSSVLDSYKKECLAANLSYKETYAEIQLALSGDEIANKTVIIRIGKGMHHEDRAVAFVNDGSHEILLMKLPHRDLAIGEVLLHSTSTSEVLLKIDHEKLISEIWEKSWYNIIRGLMDEKFDRFLIMEDAQEIVKLIEEIKGNNENDNLKEYDRDTLPDYSGFDWEKFQLHSDIDYAVIFNLNGVLIDNRDENMKAWRWILEQLRITKCGDDLLSSLASSGMLTKEILLYILGKYYTDFPNGSEVGIFASTWAETKMQKYLAYIRDNKAKKVQGAPGLLETLASKKIKRGLYSLLPLHYVNQILQQIGGVKDSFDVIITPEMVRRDYTDQNNVIGCLNEVTARLNIDKKKCFLLEDSVMCVDFAKNQGLECIGFGLENRKALKERGAICVVNDHNSLISIFEESLKYDEVVEKLRKLDEQIQRKGDTGNLFLTPVKEETI